MVKMFISQDDTLVMSATRLTLTAALLASATLASAADPFDERIANIALLQAKPIQADLKVTEAQRTKMNQHADWFNKEANKIRDAYIKQAQGKTTPPPPPTAKLQDLERQLKTKIFSVLSAGQVKRLREITIQQAGPLALLDDNVAKKVGLSATQISSIKARFKSNAEKAGKLQTDAVKPIQAKYQAKKPKNEAEAKSLQEAYNKEASAALKKIQPQLEQIQKDFISFVDKTLSAAQRQAWTALKGPAFKG